MKIPIEMVGLIIAVLGICFLSAGLGRRSRRQTSGMRCWGCAGDLFRVIEAGVKCSKCDRLYPWTPDHRCCFPVPSLFADSDPEEPS